MQCNVWSVWWLWKYTAQITDGIQLGNKQLHLIIHRIIWLMGYIRLSGNGLLDWRTRVSPLVRCIIKHNPEISTVQSEHGDSFIQCHKMITGDHRLHRAEPTIVRFRSLDLQSHTNDQHNRSASAVLLSRHHWDLPDTNQFVSVASKQGLTVGRPSQWETRRCFGRTSHHLRLQLINHNLTFQILLTPSINSKGR